MRKLGKFIDSLRLHVKGGSGGMGYPKFGGVGGKGGDVYVEAVAEQTLSKTLRAEPEKRWQGGVGGNSRKVRILGEAGEDKIIPVPLGTAVRLDKFSTLVTTVQPNIGIVEYPDKRQISMADLPGLVEGSWANMGMGHKFLRHVERTNLLLYIVDINGFKMGPQYPHRTAIENVILLNKELELYSENLLDKPCVLLVNKMDDDKTEEKLKRFLQEYSDLADLCHELPEEMQPQRLVKFDEVIPCSAKFNRDSVEYIKKRLRKWLDIYEDEINCHLTTTSAIKAEVDNKLREKSKKFV
ncbi:GTP-binding protein 10 homolog isoform X3 [Macrobrachium rosenbergii]|uniref:GTP-binding protein 10 homolog isoform X3 n=1 Tax=Macrobrachium rosenbergii TaxID=79674 RepID=UPI0034D4CDBD